MIKYRGSHLIRHGIIGVTLAVLIIAAGLQPERISSWATSVTYSAIFAEAGGLGSGDPVMVSGVKTGSVSSVELDRGRAVVNFTLRAAVGLGSETSAHIRTGSLLGQRVVTLSSAGSGRLAPRTVIPLSRTSSPYSLTEATSDLTTNTAGTDTASLNRSLDTLSETIDQIAPQLGPTFDGLTRLSQSINGRNDTLGELFQSAGDFTAILSDQSQQVNTLILDADALLGVLVERRHAIAELLVYTSGLAQQLSGLVADNEEQLAPALEKLNSVTAMLEKNSDNIAKALPGMAKYQLTQGETVSSGFYYNAFVPNLAQAQLLQPFLDYALGFRRGTDAGQPPDNAGPRAELPFPYNGIPGGSR